VDKEIYTKLVELMVLQGVFIGYTQMEFDIGLFSLLFYASSIIFDCPILTIDRLMKATNTHTAGIFNHFFLNITIEVLRYFEAYLICS